MPVTRATSGHGSLASFAKNPGLQDAADLLKQTLEEEKKADAANSPDTLQSKAEEWVSG